MLRASAFRGSLMYSELSVLFRRRRTWAMLFTISLIPIFLAIAVKLSGSTLPPGEGPPFLDRVSQNGLSSHRKGRQHGNLDQRCEKSN